MDTTVKIMEIFENAAKKITALQSGITEQTNSYEFEKSFREEMAALSQTVYQEIVSSDPINKNDRMKLMTGFGEISLRKSHLLGVSS